MGLNFSNAIITAQALGLLPPRETQKFFIIFDTVLNHLDQGMMLFAKSEWRIFRDPQITPVLQIIHGLGTSPGRTGWTCRQRSMSDCKTASRGPRWHWSPDRTAFKEPFKASHQRPYDQRNFFCQLVGFKIKTKQLSFPSFWKVARDILNHLLRVQIPTRHPRLSAHVLPDRTKCKKHFKF